MKYVLGIDFGGGSSKATLLSETGEVAAVCGFEYPTRYPKPGYVEQDPADWYRATAENIRGVIEKSGIDPNNIVMIAPDAATHTAVLLDQNGEVIRPAVYWTDTRSIDQCAYLKSRFGEEIFDKTLHLPDTIWTLPQLMWLRENEPELFAKTKTVLFAKDYVRYRLTGVLCTDFIEAEGSMLFDYTSMDWSKRLCEMGNIPFELLPELRKPTDIVGGVTPQAARETGLVAGTPVICGTTDTVMEVFAAGAVKPGEMTVKLATAGRICVVTDRPYAGKHFINYSHVAEGLWYPGTATKSCASSYRWYRDTFGETYAELDKAAEEVPAGCEGLLFHPYLNGELTPYADPLLCGSFTGLRAGHTKAHFSRAVLEGVALSLLDCKKELERAGIPISSAATIIGGGSHSSLWRQITADVLGMELRQTENSDSSFGSAMLAGVAAGAFRDLSDALERCSKTLSVTTPDPARTREYAALYECYRQIHDALAPVYHACGEQS